MSLSLVGIAEVLKKFFCNCKDESKTIEVLTDQLNKSEARNLELQKERDIIETRWIERVKVLETKNDEYIRDLIRRGRK